MKLFNTFHIVFLMYSAYKINQYEMQLFEIVGFTSTWLTYYAELYFLTFEKEDNFT